MNIYSYLYYFSVVAEEGNISRAAKRLFISQPALSTAISKLEKEVGVALFERMKNKIKLNEAGRCLYQACKESFTIIDDGLVKARQIAACNEKNVRIASSIWTVNSFIAEYEWECSDTVIELTLCDTEEIVDGVIDGKFDVGINFGHVEDNRVKELVLMEGPYCIQVNSEHPLSCRRSVSMQELANFQLFCNHLSHTYEKILSLFEAVGSSCKLLRLDESDVLFRAVEAGLGGVFFLPQPLTEQCADKLIPVTGCPEAACVVLVVNGKASYSDEVKRVCEFIVRKFQQSENALNQMLEELKGE